MAASEDLGVTHSGNRHPGKPPNPFVFRAFAFRAPVPLLTQRRLQEFDMRFGTEEFNEPIRMERAR